jgi:hypothetical protein
MDDLLNHKEDNFVEGGPSFTDRTGIVERPGATGQNVFTEESPPQVVPDMATGNARAILQSHARAVRGAELGQAADNDIKIEKLAADAQRTGSRIEVVREFDRNAGREITKVNMFTPTPGEAAEERKQSNTNEEPQAA